MEKINVHMTKDEYTELRYDLMLMILYEDCNEKAEKLMGIYRALNDWDFAEEVK